MIIIKSFFLHVSHKLKFYKGVTASYNNDTLKYLNRREGVDSERVRKRREGEGRDRAIIDA